MLSTFDYRRCVASARGETAALAAGEMLRLTRKRLCDVVGGALVVSPADVALAPKVPVDPRGQLFELVVHRGNALPVEPRDRQPVPPSLIHDGDVVP